MRRIFFSTSVFFLLFVGLVSAQSVYVTNSSGQVKNTLYTNETVYVTSSGAILTNSSEVWVYIVSDSDSWTVGTNLTAASTGRTLLTTNSTGHLVTSPIWNPPLKVGKYDLVVDADRNGAYDASDFVDNTSAVGFEVVDVPAPSLTVSLGSKSPSDHQFNISSGTLDNILVQLKLVAGGIGGSTERVKLNSITLIGNGTGNEKTGISIVKLIFDINNNFTIDSEDLLIAYSKFVSDNGILTLSLTGDKKLIMNLSTDHFLLIDSVMSADNFDGDTYKFQLISVDAVGENSGTALKLTGLPIDSTTTTIVGGQKTVMTCSGYKDQTSCPTSCQWCASDNTCRNLNDTCPPAVLPAPTQSLPTEIVPETPNYLIWIIVPFVILVIFVTLLLLRRKKPKEFVYEYKPE